MPGHTWSRSPGVIATASRAATVSCAATARRSRLRRERRERLRSGGNGERFLLAASCRPKGRLIWEVSHVFVPLQAPPALLAADRGVEDRPARSSAVREPVGARFTPSRPTSRASGLVTLVGSPSSWPSSCRQRQEIPLPSAAEPPLAVARPSLNHRTLTPYAEGVGCE
jgi:hypothetical protein